MLPPQLAACLADLTERTAGNAGPHLNIAVGYGGRQEIVDAVREVLTDALDAGAEDMHREGDVFEITCDPSNFSAVLEAIKSASIETTEAEVKYLSKMQKDLDVETGKKVVRFLEALDAVLRDGW